MILKEYETHERMLDQGSCESCDSHPMPHRILGKGIRGSDQVGIGAISFATPKLPALTVHSRQTFVQWESPLKPLEHRSKNSLGCNNMLHLLIRPLRAARQASLLPCVSRALAAHEHTGVLNSSGLPNKNNVRCISHTRSCMEVLAPIVDSHSPVFAANLSAMQLPLQQLSSAISDALQAGGDKAVKRHRLRGKMLPRERIDALLDEGSPFLELSTLAGGHGLYGELLQGSIVRHLKLF